MDVEQIHAAASEEYKNNYSTGEYCHEQSFLWGFQEGVELAEANSGKELLYVAQKTAERTKKELKIKARQWLEVVDIKYYMSRDEYTGGINIDMSRVIKDFLKAMEE